jgi:hypothetical protein
MPARTRKRSELTRNTALHPIDADAATSAPPARIMAMRYIVTRTPLAGPSSRRSEISIV